MPYTCPVCHRTSYHPEDEQWRFCGACSTYESDVAPSERSNAEQDFLAWLILEAGMKHLKLLPDGRWAAIRRLMTHHAIQCGPMGDKESVGGYWCYFTEVEAFAALVAWTGEGEPAGWFRAPMDGRRRSLTGCEVDDKGRVVGGIGVVYTRF